MSVTLVVMLLVSVVLSAASTGPATARAARKGAMKCILFLAGVEWYCCWDVLLGLRKCKVRCWWKDSGGKSDKLR